MRLYGNGVCTDCKIARMLLDKNGIVYVWADISTLPGFEGEIPLLILDDGRSVVGIGSIRRALSI